jgi:hypothetical protein
MKERGGKERVEREREERERERNKKERERERERDVQVPGTRHILQRLTPSDQLP